MIYKYRWNIAIAIFVIVGVLLCTWADSFAFMDRSVQVHFDELSMEEDIPYPQHNVYIFMSFVDGKLINDNIVNKLEKDVIIYYIAEIKQPFYYYDSNNSNKLTIVLQKGYEISRG